MERKIETLTTGEHLRIRWNMYLDADPQKALHLLVRECYINSCDEYTFYNKEGIIDIILNTEQRKICVRDNGGGIPSPKLEDAFLKINTGSNFHNRQGNLAGSMGVGIKAVSHCSSEVTIISNNSGEQTTLLLRGSEKGAVVSSRKTAKTKSTGLSIEFIPDKELFGDEWIDYTILLEELQETAKFYPHIKFQITIDGEQEVIHYPKGLRLSDTVFYCASSSVIISLALSPGEIKPFANRLYMPQGGAFFTHFKTQLTKAINENLTSKIEGKEIQSVLSGYFAVFVENPVFSNQQKSSLGNKELNPEITQVVKDLVESMRENPKWQSFVETLMKEKAADEAAKKAREKVLAINEKLKNKTVKIDPDKYKPATGLGELELYLTEGKSAASGVLRARNPKLQGVISLRGKIPNAYKTPFDKFIENAEIQTILKALGATVLDNQVVLKKPIYKKIFLLTDSDQDGLHIQLLLLAFLNKYLPQLITSESVYRFELALFRVKSGNNTQYFKTEAEAKKQKGQITRMKGIGEFEAGEVKQLYMNSGTRIEHLIFPSPQEEIDLLLKQLMGTQVKDRKEFLSI